MDFMKRCPEQHGHLSISTSILRFRFKKRGIGMHWETMNLFMVTSFARCQLPVLWPDNSWQGNVAKAPRSSTIKGVSKEKENR